MTIYKLCLIDFQMAEQIENSINFNINFMLLSGSNIFVFHSEKLLTVGKVFRNFTRVRVAIQCY